MTHGGRLLRLILPGLLLGSPALLRAQAPLAPQGAPPADQNPASPPAEPAPPGAPPAVQSPAGSPAGPPPSAGNAGGPATGAPVGEGETFGVEVRFLGLVRQSEPSLRRNIPLRDSKMYTEKDLVKSTSDTIIFLTKTGWFETVEVTTDPRDPQGRLVRNAQGVVVVYVRVKEFELIEKIEFRGFKQVDLKEVQEGIRLVPGNYLNPLYERQDVEFIRNKYLEKGFHFVRIEAIRERGGQGVTVIYRAAEGPLVNVWEIRLVGRKALARGELLEILNNKEGSISSQKPFLSARLEEDIDRLKVYYRLKGYLDVKVYLMDLVFNEDRSRVDIVVHIEEGTQYSVGTIDVEGNTLFTKEQILKELSSKSGRAHTQEDLRKDLEAIRRMYGDRSYMETEIRIETRYALEGHIVDLVYHVTEKEKVYVGRIVIQGNDRSKDKVIRRVFLVWPGEEFNLTRLELSVSRLKELGYFEDVNWSLQPGSLPGTRDIVLEVKEKPTGSIRLAAGYSSQFGVVGLLELQQRNFDLFDYPHSWSEIPEGKAFTGAGQFFRIRIAPGARRTTYSLDFREPYLFDRPVGFSFNLFRTILRRVDWDEDRVGVGVRFDRRFDFVRPSIGYQATNIDISNIGSRAPQEVRNVEGLNQIRKLNPDVTFDNTDSSVFPSKGIHDTLSYDFAGAFLGGSFDFHNVENSFGVFQTVYTTENRRKHIVHFSTNLGWERPFGDSDEVPVFERFFAGGRGTIRGFDYRGIGPQKGGAHIGGDALATAGVEYTYPLFEDFIRGAVFTDVGDLEEDWRDIRPSQFRVGAGMGLRFIIGALGNVPIAIDYAVPVHRLPGDERQSFSIDIGMFAF